MYTGKKLVKFNFTKFFASACKKFTYRVSPSNASGFVGDFKALRSLVKAGVASSADPVYFIFTIGAMGSPNLSVPLNRLPKLKTAGW